MGSLVRPPLFREARSDLAAVCTQLTELETILQSIRDDPEFSTRLPLTVREQIADVVTNCQGVVADLDTFVQRQQQRQNGLFKGIGWAVSGKSKAAGLGRQLDTHTRSLAIALEVHKL